jgi:hypothetical protein
VTHLSYRTLHHTIIYKHILNDQLNKDNMKLSVPLSLCLASSASAFSPAATQNARSATTELAAASRREMMESAFIGGIAFLATAQPALAERDFFLTEPTDEFKANEIKAMEFKRGQLKIKVQFNQVLERLSTESKTEEQLVADLEELKDLVRRTGGLPLGIKKDDMVKIIRRKKGAGFWPVPVEYR